MTSDMEQKRPNGERIAKRMASSGLCSRRDAERIIEQGRVKVNGSVLCTAAFVVDGNDVIEVDGKVIAGKPATRLFLYHKPKGLITTHRDERNRPTVFDTLPKNLPRLMSVGRLDLNTEGLLLLTNDGGLARYLELPATGWSRQYRVRIDKHIPEDVLLGLKKGITIDGIRYGSVQAQHEAQKEGKNQWLRMTIREGKNREIRRIVEALGAQVSRLIRVAYGPFLLGKIGTGEIVEVKYEILIEQIKPYFKDL